MSSPVDPNDVLMTGENSFIRYSPDGGKTQTDRVSHWRVLWCPAGAGHALFGRSTLTDAAGNYAFTGLAPGTYIVAEPAQPPGTVKGARR